MTTSRHIMRATEKREQTPADMEGTAKAGAKQAWKKAKRMRPKLSIVFLSGEANPLNLDANDRRFMVVMETPSQA